MSSHRGLGFNVRIWERHRPSFCRTCSDEGLTDALRMSSPIKANLPSSPLVILKIKKIKQWKQSLTQNVFPHRSSFPRDFSPVSCIPKSSWWPWGFMWAREEQGNLASVSHLSITAFRVIWFVGGGAQIQDAFSQESKVALAQEFWTAKEGRKTHFFESFINEPYCFSCLQKWLLQFLKFSEWQRASWGYSESQSLL